MIVLNVSRPPADKECAVKHDARWSLSQEYAAVHALLITAQFRHTF